MRKLNTIMAFCITALILSSCASKPPLVLQLPESEQSVSLNASDLKQSIGKTVRWGGTIIETKNNKDSTQIIILGYPLDSQARPNTYAQNSRRFIANFNYFLEPDTYTDKRKITVIGKLDRLEDSKIGDFNYEYPVVSVEKHAIWSTSRFYEYDPYYYNHYNYRYSYSPYYYPYFWDYNRHHYHHYY